MKNILPFLFLCCLFPGLSRAQITITNADMPSAGDTIRLSSTTNFAGITPEITDTNYTWDFSTLQFTTQTVDTFVTALSTGLYNLYFSGASFALKSNTPPISLGAITVNYEFDFFKKSTSSYVSMGQGASVTGLPLGAVNNPRDTLYRFPLNYNDLGNTSSAFAVTVPTLGFYGGSRTRIDTVDGWGTLITPYGTYSTLRVKSVVNEIDTVFITSLGFGLTLPLPERVEYKWLTNGKGLPLLQINTSAGIVSEITYRDSVRTTPVGIPTVKTAEQSIQVYPNPASNMLSIQCAPGLKVKSIEVFDVIGKKLSQFSPNGSTPLKINIADLPAGIYFLKVFTGNGSMTTRFVRQ